jgi:hypothetical protein
MITRLRPKNLTAIHFSSSVLQCPNILVALSAKNLKVNLMKSSFLQTIAVQAPSNAWMALGLPSPGMPTEQPSSLLLPFTGMFQLRRDLPAFLPVIHDVFSLKIDRRPFY